MSKIKILVVDDEKDILELLEYNLLNEGYKVYTALDGTEAIEKMKQNKPQVVLLDIMMPKLDGIETCRRMREMPEGKDCSIIILTARSEEYSEVAGFEAGADDYISKPIKLRVLLSRIKAVTRRSGPKPDKDAGETLKIFDLEILSDEYVVNKDGVPISLPKKEFELLRFLASRPGKVYKREELLENIWGSDVLVVDRTIDVHIRKLREKIGNKYIQTIKGVGYKFSRKI